MSDKNIWGSNFRFLDLKAKDNKIKKNDKQPKISMKRNVEKKTRNSCKVDLNKNELIKLDTKNDELVINDKYYGEIDILEEKGDLRINELIGLSIDKTEYFDEYNFVTEDIKLEEYDINSDVDSFKCSNEEKSAFEKFLEEEEKANLYYRYKLEFGYYCDDEDGGDYEDNN